MVEIPVTTSGLTAFRIEIEDAAFVGVDVRLFADGSKDDQFGEVEGNALNTAAFGEIRHGNRISHYGFISVVCGKSTVAKAEGAASALGGGLWT